MSRSPITITSLISAFLVMSSIASLAQTGTARARVTQAVDMHNLVTLRGNIHPLARPEVDQGVAPYDLPMNRMLLILQRGPEQEIALRQMLDQQQVKSSPQFHQWLTPEQFGQTFGPADSDLQAVTDWLATQGFEVSKVSAGRTIIEFSGSAGLVRNVLGTEIHRYRVNGEDHWANTRDPQIPTALAPVVAGFASLNNFPRKPFHQSLGTFSRSKATGEIHPLFTFSFGGSSYFGLGPADFATIYNVAPLWSAGTDGTGQAIAVVSQTNINIQDVRDFRSLFGLPANDPNIILNGPDPGIVSDEGEADLDVEWSGAVAKGATIDLVVSESTETSAGIDLSALYIIDNNLAPVMSESYGGCEAFLGAGGNQFYNTLWQQAAAQGITVLVAAGDSGSAGCDSVYAGENAAQYGLAVNGIASTPFNVAVGGTDFNDADITASYWNQTNASPSQSSAKSYIPESTWNDSCAAAGSLNGCAGESTTNNYLNGFDLIAGSGGPSSCINPAGVYPNFTCSGGYSKPSWQSGVGVRSDGARDIPDVSMFAGNGLNYSFYVLCQRDANAQLGGSSSSCDLNAPYEDFQAGSGASASVQVFAGIMALVNQAHGRQGNANYVLYPLAARSGASCNSSTAPVTNSSCIFYDVTAGNNAVICSGGSPNCSNGNSGQFGIMVSGGSPAYNTTTGYDLATGLGSVNVANLVNNWTSSFTPSTTTLALSTTPATSPITLTHGQPVNFTINVASGSGTPTGDASLIAPTGSAPNNVTGIGPFTLGSGSVSNSTVMLPGGSYNVTAHYAGNGTFAASDSTPGIPVTVSKESSQSEIRLVTFDLISNAPSYGATTTPYGSPYVLRMDVTNSSAQPCASAVSGLLAYACPTGSLTVSPAPIDVSPPPGTIPGHFALNTQGYAEDRPIQQPPGLYNFVASYAGDNSYNASTSPTVPITITQAPTTTTLTGLPATAVAGNPLNFTVTTNTTSNGAAPTGTFLFFNGATPFLAGGDYSSNSGAGSDFASIAQVGSVILPAGVLTITAQYPGDDNYAGSTSTAVPITITDFSLSANPSTVTISAPGQSGNATISVTSLYGFTGSISFSILNGCPAGATCTFSPASVSVGSGATASSTLTITTTPVTSVLPPWQKVEPPRLRLPNGLVWALAGLLGMAILLSSSLTRCRRAALLLATTLLVGGIWAACGGGSSGGAPPASTPTPAVSLSPIGLVFGSAALGVTTSPETVTLTNTGTATLILTSIGITGTDYSEFSQTNNCGSSVAAGSNCSINVTFTPNTSNTSNANLSVADNAPGSPQTVSLSGTGHQPPTPTPVGAYTISVNATGGGGSHNLQVNMNVQ